MPLAAHAWLAVLGLALALGVATGDAMGTVTVLPDIADELRSSPRGVVWVVAAFALAFTGPFLWCVAAARRGADRGVALAGCGLLLACALLAAPAQGTWWLVVARGLAGVGAAAVVAAVTPLVARCTRADHGPQATWLLAGVAGVGAVVGPITAGALTEEVGWRLLYLAGVPVTALAGWLIAAFAPSEPDLAPEPSRADPRTQTRAAVLVTAPIAAAVVVLTADAGSIGAVVVGVVALGVVIATARSAWRAAPALLDLERARGAAGRIVSGTAVASGVTAGTVVLAVLVARNVLGDRVLAVGVAVAVFGAASVLAAGSVELVSGRLPLVASLTAGALLVAGSCLLLTGAEATSSVSDLSGALAVAGLGAGALLGAGTLAVGRGAVLDGLGPHLVLARGGGAAVGTGATVAVLRVVEVSKLESFLSGAGTSLTPADHEEIRRLLSSSPYSLAALKRIAPQVLGEVNVAAREATLSGARAAFVAGAVVAVLAALLFVTAGRVAPTRSDEARRSAGPTP